MLVSVPLVVTLSAGASQSCHLYRIHNCFVSVCLAGVDSPVGIEIEHFEHYAVAVAHIEAVADPHIVACSDDHTEFELLPVE